MKGPGIRPAAKIARLFVCALSLAFGAHCFLGHPLVGAFPGEESEDEDAGLLLAALAGGGPGADASTPDGILPTAFDPVVILYTGADTSGNLLNGQATARQGADLHCATGRPTFSPNNSCTNIRAFTSLSGTDEIRDMPSNYGVPTDRPVQGPTGGATVQIANNWTLLLSSDDPILMDLQTAGIATFRWRSFSNIDGSLNPNNCLGGTDGTTGNLSLYGDRDTTGTGWLSDTQTLCSDSYRLLCVCY